MNIALNQEQQRAVERGETVEIVDPNTDRAYLIVACAAHEGSRESQEPPSAGAIDTNGIPPGILRSQRAFWHDLPGLLKARRNHGKWVGYHGDRRIGIAGSKTELIRAILERNIPRGEYYVTVIHPRQIPPWEPEEIEPLGPQHFDN